MDIEIFEISDNLDNLDHFEISDKIDFIDIWDNLIQSDTMWDKLQFRYSPTIRRYFPTSLTMTTWFPDGRP